MENWKHTAAYLREHRYVAQHPRHEVVAGLPVHIAQDVDDTWKWREAPNGMWSPPYESFSAAYDAAYEAAIAKATEA